MPTSYLSLLLLKLSIQGNLVGFGRATREEYRSAALDRIIMYRVNECVCVCDGEITEKERVWSSLKYPGEKVTVFIAQTASCYIQQLTAEQCSSYKM